MGKPTGFLEIERQVSKAVEPKKRIQNFNEFHKHLSKDDQACQEPAVWIVVYRFVNLVGN